MVVHHVDEGRHELNFSDVAATMAGEEGYEIIDDAVETITEGEMPPPYYLLTHPQAKLSDADKAILIAGIKQALATQK